MGKKLRMNEKISADNSPLAQNYTMNEKISTDNSPVAQNYTLFSSVVRFPGYTISFQVLMLIFAT